jgi:hypothetical protein
LSWHPRLRAGAALSPRLVSFGLVLPQLAGLSTPEGVRRVAERWGVEHLAGLARRYREARGMPGEPPLSDLAARLEQQQLLPAEMPPENEIAILLEEFSHSDGREIVEWLGIRSFAGTAPLYPSQQFGGGLLGGYLRRLHEAADVRERYKPAGLGDLVRSFYETLEVPHGLRAVYDSEGREQWVMTYRDLAERAALELEHLPRFAPRLSRCRLCGRVFVVLGKRPEVHCRQYLWMASPPRRFIERCVPPSPDEYERTRKRLHQRYRRALAAHDGNRRHPDVTDALKRYQAFVTSEPRSPRGRRPTPEPGYVAETDG